MPDGGSIVLVSSFASRSFEAPGAFAAYGASKAGITYLAEAPLILQPATTMETVNRSPVTFFCAVATIIKQTCPALRDYGAYSCTHLIRRSTKGSLHARGTQ